MAMGLESLSDTLSEALSEVCTSLKLSPACILVDLESERFGTVPVLVSLRFGLSSAFVNAHNISLRHGAESIMENVHSLVAAGMPKAWAIEVANRIAGVK